MLNRGLLLIILLGFILAPVYGQDPVYSQFYNAPIQLNPALVGLTHKGRVAVNYRNQLTGFPQAYTTYSASFDQYIESLNSGLGIQLLTDDAGQGIIQSNRVTGVYSYHLQLTNRLQARVGLEAGFLQTRLDWDRLIFEDQIVPGIINGSPGGTIIPSDEIRPDQLSKTVFDFGMGGLLYSDKYYVGISLKHVSNPNNTFLNSSNASPVGLPSRLTLHAGYEIDLDGYNNEGFGSFIAPSVLYTRQAGLSQLNAGALYNRENVFGGLWLRHDLSHIDAAIVSVGLRTDWLKMSYSFDLTLSSATISRTGGSHEIGVIMIIGGQKPKGSRFEDCFDLFR